MNFKHSLIVSLGVGSSIFFSQVSQAQERVVYGNDNRKDYYQTSSYWQKKADSTVALIQGYKVSNTTTGYKISTSSYGTSQNLCTTEPFYNQEISAFCSGSLIAPDIIMTAGHCVRTEQSCQQMRFVFNFNYKTASANPSEVGEDDVYFCKTLIHSQMNSTTGSDFALVQLDRAVVGKTPLPLHKNGAVSVGDPLVVIGHPSGLPTKIADEASVRSDSPIGYFVANLDTYGGNSGSAVFNEKTGLVEGILVRGENDFSYSNGCYVSNVCKTDGCRGEDVTRVSEVLSYLPSAQP